VYIDIVNVFRFHAGIVQGVFHHGCRSQSIGMGCSHVMSVGRHTHTDNFGIDFRSTSLGVIQFFQDEASATLGHDETVAAFAERSRGGRWVIVAGGDGVQGVETTHTCRGNGSF